MGCPTTISKIVPVPQDAASGAKVLDGSIPSIIGVVNGEAWLERWSQIHAALLPRMAEVQEKAADLAGCSVYATDQVGDVDPKRPGSTRYDVVNAWQTNVARGTCDTDGRLLRVHPTSWSDEQWFAEFYDARKPAGAQVVLDVGCNTGRNMIRAMENSAPGSEAFGIEYSPDSATVAGALFPAGCVVQGDASGGFVEEQGWAGKFSALQCTVVIQHMVASQVEQAISNMAHCLRQGGELLLTFKDCPTRAALVALGMGEWADQFFTADVVGSGAVAEYEKQGFLRAVMWDDDYYLGVADNPVNPPIARDLGVPGMHRREFVFYSLAWVRATAANVGLEVSEVEVLADSKIPLSALTWKLVLKKQ